MSMHHRACFFIAKLGLIFALMGSAHADLVQYNATSLGGNTWRYDYTITPAASGFDELTIYFDPTRYTALRSGVAASGWDPLVVQPDTGIPADGFFDVLNLNGLLAGADTITGFSIVFDYLATGAPGDQAFDLYDSSDFTLVGSGRTVHPQTNGNAVPEPRGLALAALGLGCLAWARRRTPHRSQVA